mmetsp:Transcript_8148/g.17253  ORF Transcript_8148/g.17253 Transcript_8148/m.17253 type:complete len:289 (-) Transcript_8148:116-982(-)
MNGNRLLFLLVLLLIPMNVRVVRIILVRIRIHRDGLPPSQPSIPLLSSFHPPHPLPRLSLPLFFAINTAIPTSATPSRFLILIVPAALFLLILVQQTFCKFVSLTFVPLPLDLRPFFFGQFAHITGFTSVVTVVVVTTALLALLSTHSVLPTLFPHLPSSFFGGCGIDSFVFGRRRRMPPSSFPLFIFVSISYFLFASLFFVFVFLSWHVIVVFRVCIFVAFLLMTLATMGIGGAFASDGNLRHAPDFPSAFRLFRQRQRWIFFQFQKRVISGFLKHFGIRRPLCYRR